MSYLHHAASKFSAPLFRKERKRLESQHSGRSDFSSLRDFLHYAARLLTSDCSPALMKQLIREAHQVADELHLTKKRRGKMHAFMAKMEEALLGMDAEKRVEFVDQQFRQFDPKLVNCD